MSVKTRAYLSLSNTAIWVLKLNNRRLLAFYNSIAKKVSFHEKGQHLGEWNEQPNEHTNDSSETGMQRAKSAASNLFQKMTKQKPPPNRRSAHLYTARADFRSVDALFNFRMHDDDDDD